MRRPVPGLAILVVLACSCSSSGSEPGAGGAGGGNGGNGGSKSSSGGAGMGGSSGGTSGASNTSCTEGSATTLPKCTTTLGASINVPAGCRPTVDGAYHAGEWGDAACLSAGNDPVYLKYAGDTLYLAWSMTPTCGCGAQLAFSKDSAQTLDGSQFDLALLDDPFGSSGDASELISKSGGWGSQGAVASGIVIANPPNQPSPVTYELAIPFAQLGITAGQAKTVGMAIHHSSDKVPSGLTFDATVPSLPANPASWLGLTSSANWR